MYIINDTKIIIFYTMSIIIYIYFIINFEKSENQAIIRENNLNLSFVQIAIITFNI